MNKRSVRALGIGFLLSGVLVGAYNFLNPNNTQTVSDQDTEVLASLESENNDLKAENTSLNDEIAVIKESTASSNSNQSNDQDESESQSSQASNNDESNENSNNEDQNSSENENEANQNQDDEDNESTETNDEGLATPEDVGTFTVAEGSSTSEIAQQLEDAGYISSADDFTSLIEEWGLETVIVADEYTLNSDMSIHDIANIITQGAYYYY